MALVFWSCLSLILYSLFGYGLIWIALALIMPARPQPSPEPQKATFLIAARNEARHIAGKLVSILSQDTGPHEVDILVVSDGSDDDTVGAVRDAFGADSRVRVIALEGHNGKASALNEGLARIAPDRIVIFSDANSILGAGAIGHLLAPFSDPKVGGSVGQLQIPASTGLLARAERLFWRYDNALKAAEDRVAGVVSAQGTLYAVRRHLVPPVPADVADDLWTSLAVVDQRHRLAFAPGATATETVTANVGGEFGRRVRSTERGWRGLMHYARLMNPVRTGLYGVQLFSHKALRRLVAFLLPLLFVSNLALWDVGPAYRAMLTGQVAVYGMALVALATGWGRRVPGASAAAMFALGHAAMFWAIVRYCAGVRSTKWSPIRN